MKWTWKCWSQGPGLCTPTHTQPLPRHRANVSMGICVWPSAVAPQEPRQQSGARPHAPGHRRAPLILRPPQWPSMASPAAQGRRPMSTNLGSCFPPSPLCSPPGHSSHLSCSCGHREGPCALRCQTQSLRDLWGWAQGAAPAGPRDQRPKFRASAHREGTQRHPHRSGIEGNAGCGCSLLVSFPPFTWPLSKGPGTGALALSPGGQGMTPAATM